MFYNCYKGNILALHKCQPNPNMPSLWKASNSMVWAQWINLLLPSSVTRGPRFKSQLYPFSRFIWLILTFVCWKLSLNCDFWMDNWQRVLTQWFEIISGSEMAHHWRIDVLASGLWVTWRWRCWRWTTPANILAAQKTFTASLTPSPTSKSFVEQTPVMLENEC